MPPPGWAAEWVTHFRHRCTPTRCLPSWQAPVGSAGSEQTGSVCGQGCQWEPRRADVRARNVDVRGRRHEEPSHEVAMPDRRVLAEVSLGQGHPPDHPARDEAVAQPLPRTRRRRARVRTLEARVRAVSAPRARPRQRPATRRPRHARPPESGARAGASRTTRSVGATPSSTLRTEWRRLLRVGLGGRRSGLLSSR